MTYFGSIMGLTASSEALIVQRKTLGRVAAIRVCFVSLPKLETGAMGKAISGL